LTKRLIEIEDDLLQQAREALGTETIKDTVPSRCGTRSIAANAVPVWTTRHCSGSPPPPKTSPTTT
jgi:hypothetical protein